jgi:hypothetical protein
VRDVDALIHLYNLDHTMSQMTTALHAQSVAHEPEDYVVDAVDNMVGPSNTVSEYMRSQIRRRMSAQLYELAMEYAN